MAYTKQTWHDWPTADTPLSAARLGHVEDGVYDASVKAEGPINPMWPEYGAKFDNTADDTTALQAALDAAGAVTTGGATRGAMVRLPPGQARFSSLTIPPDVTVEGEGIGATRLLRIAGSTGIAVRDDDNAQRISLRKFRVIQADAGSHGIELGYGTFMWGSGGEINQVQVDGGASSGSCFRLKADGGTSLTNIWTVEGTIGLETAGNVFHAHSVNLHSAASTNMLWDANFSTVQALHCEAAAGTLSSGDHIQITGGYNLFNGMYFHHAVNLTNLVEISSTSDNDLHGLSRWTPNSSTFTNWVNMVGTSTTTAAQVLGDFLPRWRQSSGQDILESKLGSPFPPVILGRRAGIQLGDVNREVFEDVNQATATWAGAAVNNNTMATTSVTLSGAVAGKHVIVALDPPPPAGVVVSGTVRAAGGIVDVSMFNLSGSTWNAPSTTVRVCAVNVRDP